MTIGIIACGIFLPFPLLGFGSWIGETLIHGFDARPQYESGELEFFFVVFFTLPLATPILMFAPIAYRLARRHGFAATGLVVLGTLVLMLAAQVVFGAAQTYIDVSVGYAEDISEIWFLFLFLGPGTLDFLIISLMTGWARYERLRLLAMIGSVAGAALAMVMLANLPSQPLFEAATAPSPVILTKVLLGVWTAFGVAVAIAIHICDRRGWSLLGFRLAWAARGA